MNRHNSFDDWPIFDDTSTEQAKLPVLAVVSAATLAGQPIPTRRFHVADLIPARNVTLLTGDGGAGKSQIALQLAASTALNTGWLGMHTEGGAVLYLSAEDELDELHRRLADITSSYRRDIAELTDLHIVPLAGLDAVLAAPIARSNLIAPTTLWHQVRDQVAKLKPVLVVADTLADLYAGDENQRGQVRQFVTLLRGLALEFDTTVVMLAHPSLTGMANGTGSSGSTGWANSARSRLYLSRVLTSGEDKGRPSEADPDLRLLTSTKANYGRTGGEIRLRWCLGVFETEGGAPRSSFDKVAADQSADEVFLDLLKETLAQGRHFSPSPSASYAPAAFCKMEHAKGFTKRVLAHSMERLLTARVIKVAETGPKSRTTKVLLLADMQA
jgi:RecA-family ATPase